MASPVLSATGSAFLTSVVATALVLGIAMLCERRVMPARKLSFGHVRFNLVYTIVLLAIVAVARPLALIFPLALTCRLGVGLISFPPGVWGWMAAFVCTLVFTDLLEYLWHRMQHTYPLWSMHELHHSAPQYDVTLTYRHFWLEPILKTSFVYPWVGLLFQVPASVATAVVVVFMLNHHLAHMNARVHLHRFSLLISNPQYHRFHHSRHEAHYNKNFCDLLPLWDWLFGTMHRLDRDEFVDVGLDSGEMPRTLVEALAWPWRKTRYTALAQNAKQESCRTD